MKGKTLTEVVRLGILKIGDKVEMDSSILPKEGLIVLGSTTGYEQKQFIMRDNAQFYYAGTEEDGAIKFVATKATGSKLILKGEKGFENGLSILQRICSNLFSMNSLGIFSSPLKFEEFQEYFLGNQTEDFAGKILSRGEVFLATPYIRKDESTEVNDMPILSCGFKCFLGYIELMKGNSERSMQAGILPTIKMYLPEYIYFDENEGKTPRLVGTKSC